MANYNLTQTGAEVQVILDRVAAGYIYMGTADLTTTPDTTNPNVCYLLTAVGTYTNFGNVTHSSGITIAKWNGSAWTSENVPSSAVVQTDKAVETLFIESNSFVNSGYISASGAIVEHSVYKSTDLLATCPGSSIKYNQLKSPGATYPIIAYYNKEQVFIGSVGGGSSALSGTAITPDNAYFVRLSMHNAPSSFNPAAVISNKVEESKKALDMIGTSDTDYVRHFNICEEGTWTDNYVNASNGYLSAGGGTWFTSQLLKVKPLSDVYIYGVLSANDVISVAYYDENFAFLSSLSVKGLQYYEKGKKITIPETAQYARFVIRTITGGFRGYVETISVEIYEPQIKKEKSPIEGKVVAFFGDSITAGANVTPVTDGTIKPFPYLISDEVGIFPMVAAAPGSYFMYVEGSQYSIPAQVELCEITPDLIVLEGGVNDYASGRSFGSVDYGSATMYTDELQDTTFCGGLEKTIRLLATKYPSVPIMYVIATKARDYEWTQNSGGQTYRDYVEEIIKVCGKYGIKVVNLHDDANLVPQMSQYKDNANYTYQGDNLHPTTLSYKKFYVNRIIDGLLSINPT